MVSTKANLPPFLQKELIPNPTNSCEVSFNEGIISCFKRLKERSTWFEPSALAIALHNKYEKLSVIEGWKTQNSCRVDFEKLPDANKRVMLGMAHFIHNLFLGGTK